MCPNNLSCFIALVLSSGIINRLTGCHYSSPPRRSWSRSLCCSFGISQGHVLLVASQPDRCCPCRTSEEIILIGIMDDTKGYELVVIMVIMIVYF